MQQPLVLCILDGWGVRQAAPDNAITTAYTPVWDKLMQQPYAALEASGEAVGLPAAQMGNSEVGHMTIGAGRVILQDLPRIDTAVAAGNMSRDKTFLRFVNDSLYGNGTVHLLGLLSPGGVHSHQDHIFHLAEQFDLAKLRVIVHAILDGRDTPPKSALESLNKFMEVVPSNIQMGSISGRFYAMDRDSRWERTQLAYQAIVHGQAPVFADATTALQDAYKYGEMDEFVKPRLIKNYSGMQDGDAVCMANFRSDRVRQLLRSMIHEEFSEFERGDPVRLSVAMGMVAYSDDLGEQMLTLFPKQPVANSLGEIVAQQGLKQYRVAETEKYAHVTFFLNGGREEPFANEQRRLVASPDVKTYDLKPEMSASAVTEALVNAIASQEYSLLVVNFANPDMVGHTGKFAEIVRAIEAVDGCLGKVLNACGQYEHTLVVTADHGNAEQTYDVASKSPLTAHSLNKVPFIVANSDNNITLKAHGGLQDIAPTVLQLLGLDQPPEMTGRSLIK